MAAAHLPRWLKNLGPTAPLVVSLVAALLVAGSFRLMLMVGDAPSGTGHDVGGSTSEGGTGITAVPLGRTDIKVDRPVDADLGRTGTAADELRQHGRIGDNDTLAPAERENQLGSRVLTRTRQEHQSIPVFAADIVVTTEDDRIIRIHGHPAPDIELENKTPANDYPATVALTEVVLDHAIATEDDGALVIMPVDGGYRLAWLGKVVIDQGPEQVALDAENGEVLHRVPLIRQAKSEAWPTGKGDR